MCVSSPYLYSDGTVKIGALTRIGALINKNTPEGGALIQKGAPIERRRLNRLITVFKQLTNIYDNLHASFI